MTTATAPATLAGEAWEALRAAQAAILRELADEDAASGVLPTEYGVLCALSEVPGGRPIGELAESVMLSQPGLSRLVARLEHRGLVSRSADPSDRRVCLLHLTDEGAELQRRVGTGVDGRIARLLTGALGPSDLEAVRDLCRAIVARSEENGAGAQTRRTRTDER